MCVQRLSKGETVKVSKFVVSQQNKNLFGKYTKMDSGEQMDPTEGVEGVRFSTPMPVESNSSSVNTEMQGSEGIQGSAATNTAPPLAEVEEEEFIQSEEMHDAFVDVVAQAPDVGYAAMSTSTANSNAQQARTSNTPPGFGPPTIEEESDEEDLRVVFYPMEDERNINDVAGELPTVSYNQPVVYNDNTSSSDDSNIDLRSVRYGLPTSEDHVQAAIRELIARGRRSEGGVAALLNRENFMQRMRRIIFSMDGRNGQRGNGNQNNNANPMSDDEDEVDDLATAEAPVAEPENPIRFDTNLPTEHSYLGANMNRVSSVNYLEVGQTYKMMLFMHHHILFPGEILPFMISGSIIESDIDAHNGLLFGVCFPFVRRNIGQDEYMYGVTCQIYEKGTDDRGNTLVKSSALQRFIVKSNELTGPLQFISAHGHGKCYGFVKILPESYLPEPLKCINMGTMSRFRDITSMQNSYQRFQAASTPWPAHIYDRYNISSVVDGARTQLAQHKIDSMPSEPISLSFWLIRNLHLSESLMKTLFMTDSVNVRMNLIADTFKEEALFTCRYCGNRIANCRELFAMSKHGVQTQYCNSAGYIHETNTVYNVVRNSVSFSGQPSTEFSWFPGYQWQIIICKVCSRHIGWEFKGIEKNLVPVRFYGISSSSVRISSPSYIPSDPRAEIYNNVMEFAHRAMQ